MTITMTIILVAAAIVTIAIGVSECVRWIYRQGQKSVEDRAKTEALEARVTELKAELAQIKANRPRALSLTDRGTLC